MQLLAAVKKIGWRRNRRQARHALPPLASAGAAGFKRNRGARAVIEYSAWFTDHLAWPRRLVIAGLENLLQRVAVPIMVERGL